ncbi:MAG TPA: YkgJ family cysteine cluster protein, partial [Polyangiaceae bacterium]|nr:YkgJ family cysteine cluster protein [Polyangiaceae bacterium]
MTAMLVTRPVVRSFRWRFVAEAASWVRAGGHAVVWLTARKARLVFTRPGADDDGDLGHWSVLDIGRTDYAVARRGPLAGMAYVRVPHDCYRIVRARVTRDSIHPGPTRSIELDCLACGACCRDNRV